MLAMAQGAVARVAAYVNGKQDIGDLKLTLNAHPSNGASTEYTHGTLGYLLQENDLRMSALKSRRSDVAITQEVFDMLLHGKCEDQVDFSLRYMNHQLRHFTKREGGTHFVSIKLTVQAPAVRQARNNSKQPASRTVEPPKETLKILSLVEAPVTLTYYTRTKGWFTETLGAYRRLAPEEILNQATDLSA